MIFPALWESQFQIQTLEEWKNGNSKRAFLLQCTPIFTPDLTYFGNTFKFWKTVKYAFNQFEEELAW